MDTSSVARAVGRACGVVGRCVGKATVRTGELAGKFGKVCSLRTQIRRLENRQEDRFARMGRTLYQHFLDGKVQEEEILALCQEVRSMDETIAQLQDRIDQVRAQSEQPDSSCVQTTHSENANQ